MDKIYSSNLICIRSGAPIEYAKQIMNEKKIQHLPLIDSEENIIAMLSYSDVITNEKFKDMPVDFFANSPVTFADQDMPLSDVAYKMLDHKTSSVIICNDESQAIGIITTNDMLLQFAKLLKEKENSHRFNTVNVITTVGEFFRKLSDIGI